MGLEKDREKPSFIRSAAAMSVGTLVSRVLGYIRDALMLALFPRIVTDAYIVAFRLPNLARRLFGEGSLSVSFVPVYVDELVSPASDPEEVRKERARRLANAVYSLLSLVTMTLTALLMVFMEPLIVWWVGGDRGFTLVPGKLELTVELSRIMSLYLFLVTAYAYFMAIANSLHKFFWPAMAPAFFNGVLIIFTLLPSESMGSPGAALAWGVVAGGVAQAALMVWLLRKEGMMPRWTLQLRVPGVARVLRNMGPGILGLGVYQLMTLANTFFAARLPEGAQSYIYAADRILELPQSLVAISLGTALLPTMSQQLSLGQLDRLRATAAQGLRAMLFLGLPSAVGMAFVAEPIVRVLFERGSFGAEDVRQTALVIEVYSVLLLASSISKVTTPAFYARGQTWIPAVVAFFCLVVHLFVAQAGVNSYGIVGLAGATAISGILNMLILQIWFRLSFGPMGWRSVLDGVLRMSPGLVAMALWLIFVHPEVDSLLSSLLGPHLGHLLTLVFTIGVTSLLYFVLCLLSRSPEALSLWQRVASRLNR